MNTEANHGLVPSGTTGCARAKRVQGQPAHQGYAMQRQCTQPTSKKKPGIAGLFYASLVVLRRQLVDGLEEGSSVSRIDFRGDAMAEVEHVAAAGAIGRKDARHLGANRRRLGIEHRRVHVALQGNLGTDTGAGATDVAGPVQT